MGSGLAFKHSGSVIGNMSLTERAESTEKELDMPCRRVAKTKHRSGTGSGLAL